ncbi:tetratricopeptide repeat protein [bacterium]|nr:tetratricopeptide repeat protein [bacterium]
MITNAVRAAASLLLFIVLISCQGKGLPGDHYFAGLNHAVKGELEKAEKKFMRALSIDGTHQQSSESLGVVRDSLKGDIDSEAVVHFFMGIMLANEGRFEGAAAEYTRALDMFSRFASAYYERGISLAVMGQYKEAIEDFTKVIELKPGDAAAYNNRGLAYGKGISDLERAIADFTSAVTLDPEFAEAYENRGIAYRMMNNEKSRACADWETACTLGACKSAEIAKKAGFCR